MMGFAYLNAAGYRTEEKPGSALLPQSEVACQPRANSEVEMIARQAVGVNQGVLDGKSILTALRKCSVEISKRLIGQQMIATSGAEEKLYVCREELKMLSTRLLAIQENERRRIASDLHDGIGQSMSLIKMSMESVVQMLDAGLHQQADQTLQLTIHKVRQTMTELRSITTELRPAMLDDLGLIPTLSWFFREFEASVRNTKMKSEICVTDSDMNVQLKTTIFRIIQEAMNNIVKHADARCVSVSLKKVHGTIELKVEDDGRGFDQARLLISRESTRGMGLMTMKERARSSDGIFDMQSTPGQGTCIRVSWRQSDARAERRAEILHKLHRAQLAIAL